MLGGIAADESGPSCYKNIQRMVPFFKLLFQNQPLTASASFLPKPAIRPFQLCKYGY
jgi:hypothetical protein